MRIKSVLLLPFLALALMTCDDHKGGGIAVEGRLSIIENDLELLVTMGLNFDPQKLRELKSIADSLYFSSKHPKALALSKTIGGIVEDGDNEKAIQLYLEALDIAQENKFPFCEGLLFELLGKKYFALGEYESVQDLFRLSLSKWNELGYPNRSGYVHCWIGIDKERQSENDSALFYFREGKRLFDMSQEDLSVMAANNLLSGVLNKEGEFSESISLGKESIALSQKMKDKWFAQANKDLALTYEAASLYDSAIVHYKVAMKFSDDIERSFTTYYLAKVLFQRGSLSEAKSNLQTALGSTEYDPNRFMKFRAMTYKLLSEIEASMGNSESAYVALLKHTKLKESLTASDLKRDERRTASSYEAYLAKKEAAKEEERATNQKIANYLIIVFVLFLLAFLILSVRSFKRKKKDSEQLARQNQIIASSLSERESLLKEIHHRVKNNLQIIASLLYLQSGKFDNEDYKKVLEEGQGRVRSMALIHQKLYENEDLKSIPFDEYLMELVTEIRASFGAEMNKVSIDIEAENIQFDIDTAIPLGLIVNEMATNAFKYAFKDLDSGSFSVSIHKDQGEYSIKIQDDGRGIPESVDIRKVKSLGLRLVRMLSQQLEADFHFETENGTSFELKFAA